MNTILLIEDDFKMRKVIKDYLESENYEVIEASDGVCGLELFEKTNAGLVILDIMMPGFDGWFVCREIRKESKIPIIILTARSEESDELLGFELGADDYITKPFNPQILSARVRSLLKRSVSGDNREKIGDLLVDYNNHTVRLDGKLIELTKKEYELLVMLINNRGMILSREKIIFKIWGHDYDGDYRVVDTNIKRLRSKLQNRFIQTKRGFGYTLI